MINITVLKYFFNFLTFSLLFFSFPVGIRAEEIIGDYKINISPEVLYADMKTFTVTITPVRTNSNPFILDSYYSFLLTAPSVQSLFCQTLLPDYFKPIDQNKLERTFDISVLGQSSSVTHISPNCWSNPGVWHLKIWLGNNPFVSTPATAILIHDSTFLVQPARVGGVIPQLDPIKSPLSMTENPGVRLINAKKGYFYQFWWDGAIVYWAYKNPNPTIINRGQTFTVSSDGDYTLNLTKDGGDFSQPGNKVLCMEASTSLLGLNLSPATSNCIYKTIFDFQLTPPTPGFMGCSIANPKPPEEGDSVSLKINNGPANENLYVKLDDSKTETKIGPQKSDNSGILLVTLGSNMAIGNYTANVFDTNDKPICQPVSFSVYKKGSVPTSATKKACSEEEIRQGKCNSAAGKQCVTSDPTNPAISTAIGCIHTNPAILISDLFKFLLGISGGLAFLMMLLSGIQMIVSQGNPQALATAKGRFTSALIGLLFVIFSMLLMQIIGFDILKLPGFAK